MRFLFALILESLINPRGGIRQFLTLNLPSNSLFWGIGLYSIIMVFLSDLNLFAQPTDGATPPPNFIPNFGYLGDFALGVGSVYLSAGLYYGIGRFFGGIGSFKQSVQTALWFNVVQFPVFLAMLADFAIVLYLIEQGGWLSTIFTPILSGGLLFAMGLLIVVYCRFIAELHQFKNAGYVFFISLAVALGFALVASLVFVSLGYTPATQIS